MIKCSLFLLILLLITLSIFIKAYYFCINKIFLIFILNFKEIMNSLTSCMDEEKLPEKSFPEKVILINNSSTLPRCGIQQVSFFIYNRTAPVENHSESFPHSTRWNRSDTWMHIWNGKFTRHRNIQPQQVPKRKPAGWTPGKVKKSGLVRSHEAMYQL